MRSTVKTIMFAALSAGLAFAQSKFSERLTAEERRAVGLDLLTPAQVEALDALVARENRAGGATAKAPAVSKSTTKATAAKPATAQTTVAEAAEGPAEKKTRAFGLPEKENVNAITGTLLGEFRGWNGNTIFRLEDGQIWMQTDRTDTHQTSPRQNVRVKIEKSMFGGYKLTAEGDPMWVRVRRVQ
ncbi:MAG: hypothetical protein HZA93_23195 [Verrucomicrobia bacterium]|nr:hypothetical protein [Verrucomicrobiota bacterium]